MTAALAVLERSSCGVANGPDGVQKVGGVVQGRHGAGGAVATWGVATVESVDMVEAVVEGA